MKDIVLLSGQRTGSTYLNLIFDNFDNFVNLREFFTNTFGLNNGKPTFLPFKDTNILTKELGLGCLDFEKLTDYIRGNAEKTYKVVKKITPSHTPLVLKVHRNDIQKHNLDFIFDKNIFNHILITRTDYLAQYASLMIAEQLNAYSNVDTSNWRIRIDSIRFEKFVLRERQLLDYTLYKLGDNNYLSINYESDILNKSTTDIFNKVEKWLRDLEYKFDVFDNKINLIKQQNSDLKYTIINYDEIVKSQ